MRQCPGGRIYPRYLLPLLPVFAAVASAVLIESMPKPWIATAVGLVVLCASAPGLDAIPKRVFKKDWQDVSTVSQRFRSLLTDDESPVFIYPRHYASFPPSAFLYYTDLPVKALIQQWNEADEFEARARKQAQFPPYLGIAHRNHLPIVEAWLGRVTVVENVAEWTIWRHVPGEEIPAARPGSSDAAAR